LNLSFDTKIILIHSCGQSIYIRGLPLVEVIHLDGGEDVQPSIEAKEDANESSEVDEEDELLADQIQASRKVDSIGTIEALRMKPSSFSSMPIPLCRLVAMPIVKPTLSSDLASLEDNFMHGYWEGAVVFYLFTTNEGGQVDKVTDEDLKS
jgi:hypothetical protein